MQRHRLQQPNVCLLRPPTVYRQGENHETDKSVSDWRLVPGFVGGTAVGAAVPHQSQLVGAFLLREERAEDEGDLRDSFLANLRWCEF